MRDFIERPRLIDGIISEDPVQQMLVGRPGTDLTQDLGELLGGHSYAFPLAGDTIKHRPILRPSSF
jgi:hypothetical protein